MAMTMASGTDTASAIPPAVFPERMPVLGRFPATPVSASKPPVNHPHARRLMALDLSELNGAYLSTYEVKEVHEADALTPSACTALGPGVAAARVYDTAVLKGVHCLGIAPAHRSRGKYVHGTRVQDARRVFCGPPKLPHARGTVYSPLPEEEAAAVADGEADADADGAASPSDAL